MRALEDILWKVAPERIMLKIHDASDRLKCCSAMLRGAAVSSSDRKDMG